MKQKKPKKWTEVYPQGTKEGDEEQRLFIALGRHPKYDWRSVAALAKEANLTKTRTEEILNKYHQKGLVFQNPKTDDQWGYWERVPHMLPSEAKTVVQRDQDGRIEKVLNSDACFSAFESMYSDVLEELESLKIEILKTNPMMTKIIETSDDDVWIELSSDDSTRLTYSSDPIDVMFTVDVSGDIIDAMVTDKETDVEWTCPTSIDHKCNEDFMRIYFLNEDGIWVESV